MPALIADRRRSPDSQLISPGSPVFPAANMSPTPRATHGSHKPYSSPPFAANSSVTPPPSSHGVSRLRAWSPSRTDRPAERNPVQKVAPPVPSLSSPPLTGQRSTSRPTPVPSTSGASLALPPPPPPLSTQIARASPAELRAYVESMRAEVERLAAALADARTAAAHYKLQYNLLNIESDEAAKRMAVEQQMRRREVEVLQQADPEAREMQRLHRLPAASPAQIREALLLPPPSSLSPPRTLLALKKEAHAQAQAQSLRAENEVLRRRLRRAKKLILFRDGEVHSLLREREMLKQRIKENREHFNHFRRMYGSYEGGATPGAQADSAVNTPPPPPPPQLQLQHEDPPRLAAEWMAAPLVSGDIGGRDTFAALLLADQVLSQESASAHSTPTPVPPLSRARHPGHTRGTQSLSSLPSTHSLIRPPPTPAENVSRLPLSPRLAVPSQMGNVSRAYNNDDFAASPSKGQAAGLPPGDDDQSERQSQQRMDSTDSTIWASSEAEDALQATPHKRPRLSNDSFTAVDSYTVPESQASQLTAHLLRHRSSPTSATRRSANGGGGGGGNSVRPRDNMPKRTSQQRLVGRIQKAGVSRDPLEKKPAGEEGVTGAGYTVTADDNAVLEKGRAKKRARMGQGDTGLLHIEGGLRSVRP